MAQDEMNTITEDRWDEDIWGIEHEGQMQHGIPKLIFYFGQNVPLITLIKSFKLTNIRTIGWQITPEMR
jgi:hypothetical protein